MKQIYLKSPLAGAFMSLALVCSLASCSDRADLPNPGPDAPDINVLEITGDCAYHEVTNNADAGWKILSAPAWITPVASEGTASTAISLYVESNTQALREGTIEILYSDGATRSVAVRQSPEQTPLSLQRSHAVGWGMDVRTHRDSRGLTDQIFNAQRILALDPAGIQNEVYTHTEHLLCYGSSYDEFQSNLQVQAHVNIKSDAFTMDLQGAFGKSAMRQSNRAFAWFRDRYDERCVSMLIDPMDAILGGGFTADFQKQYDEVVKSNGSDESIRNLIDRYGTHYVTVAVLGGYLDYFYSFEHSEMSDGMEIEATLTCAVKEKFTLDGDVAYKDNLEMLSETAIESFKVMGGDAMTLTNLIVAGKQSQDALNAWAASLRVEDGVNAALELIDFQLQPISNLFQVHLGKGIPGKIDNFINRTLYYSTVPVTRKANK